MTEQRFQLAEKLRTYISKYGINDFNEEHLQKVGLTLEELKEISPTAKTLSKPYWSMNGDVLKKSSMNTISKGGTLSILC